MKLELLRKIFHIISISLLIIPLEIFGKISIIILMGGMLLIFFPISYFRIKNRWTFLYWELLKHVERKQNWDTLPAKQAFALAFGLIISALFFDEKTLKVAILTTAIYDGFATILGKLFGRHKIPYTRKSIEGSLGGMLINTLVLSFFIPVEQSLLVSLFASFIELFANSKKIFLDDNFLIPVSVSIFFSILP